VLVLAGLGWLVLGSPVLEVRQVRVLGTDRVPVADVLRTADPERGRPMVLVDLAGVSRRVNALPLVHDVRVVRQWPGTLVVTVHERVAVAAVPASAASAAGKPASGAASTVRLVDRDGVEVGSGPKPAGLPYLQVDLARSGAATMRAALAVLDSLPANLRTGLKGIGADSPDGVWLTLSDGVRVVWGDATDSDRKAAVLHAVITASDPARLAVVDVSAPDAPAVTNRR
jgi:cell division protein FtsQ